MYTIYAVEHVPEAMLAKYPNPALYAEGQLCLFGETLEQVTGTAAESISDVSAYGFEGETGMTAEQLNAEVDRLLELMGSAEVHLSKVQGQYLYATRFKPVEVEEE